MNQQQLHCAGALFSDSWIIRLGIIIAIVAGITFLVIGMIFGPCLLAALLAAGVGAAARKSKQWETGRRIPGMNEAFAGAALKVAVFIWLFVMLFLLARQEMTVGYAGLALLLIMSGLWLGYGDKYAEITQLVIIIVCGAGLAFADSVENLYQTVTIFYQFVFGPLMIFAGLAIMARVYWIACSSGYTGESAVTSLLSGKESVDTHAAFTSSSESQSNQWRSDEFRSYDPGLYKEASQQPEESRLNQLVFESSSLKATPAFWVLAIFVVFALYKARGIEQAYIPLQWTSCMFLVALPPILFAVKLKQAFELLWLTGTSPGRASTARTIALLVCKRSVICYCLILMALTVQLPVNFVELAEALLHLRIWINFGIQTEPPFYNVSQIGDVGGIASLSGMICMMSISLGIGAVLLLVSAITFRFWSRHTDVAVFVFLILVTISSIVLMPGMGNVSWIALGLFDTFGMFAATCITLIGTALCWYVGIELSAKRLGRESTLLE